MVLNGWQRMWVLLAVIYGITVISFAFLDQPQESSVRSKWLYEASDLIAKKIEENSGKRVHGYQVREKITEGRSYSEATDWLKATAESPGESQEIFSNELGLINQRYQRKIDELSKAKTSYFLVAAVLWLVPVTILYALGWTIGWIVRGFKETMR